MCLAFYKTKINLKTNTNINSLMKYLYFKDVFKTIYILL